MTSHDHDREHTHAHPGSEAWHRMTHHTEAGQLSEDTARANGMRRYEDRA
jgi:hypothetical protein